MKWCYFCQRWKEENENNFAVHLNRADGLRSECVVCNRKRLRENYLRHRVERMEKMRERRRRLKSVIALNYAVPLATASLVVR
jgi:hypothetical protein